MTAPPTWPPGTPLTAACAQHGIVLAFCPTPGLRAAQSQAVRACAVALLTRAGVAAPVIGRHADGQPLWPAGWVGSLTHSRSLGAAALAPAARLRSLGVDLEDPLRMKPAMSRHIMTAAEIAAHHPAADTFSAKEAIYKTLAPLTPAVPGFHDVELVWSATGEFRVQPAAGRTVSPLVAHLRGLVTPHHDHILALCWLPAV